MCVFMASGGIVCFCFSSVSVYNGFGLRNKLRDGPLHNEKARGIFFSPCVSPRKGIPYELCGGPNQTSHNIRKQLPTVAANNTNNTTQPHNHAGKDSFPAREGPTQRMTARKQPSKQKAQCKSNKPTNQRTNKQTNNQKQQRNKDRETEITHTQTST